MAKVGHKNCLVNLTSPSRRALKAADSETLASRTPSLHCSMKATTMSCTGRTAGTASDNLGSISEQPLVVLVLLLGVDHPRELLAHHKTVVPACNSTVPTDNKSSDSWMMEKTSGRIISVALAASSCDAGRHATCYS